MEAVQSIALALEHMQEAMRVMKVQMERTDETVRDVAQGLTTQGEIIQKIDLRMELFERRASPVPSAAFACCAAPPAPALAFPAHAHAHAHAHAPAGAALPTHHGGAPLVHVSRTVISTSATTCSAQEGPAVLRPRPPPALLQATPLGAPPACVRRAVSWSGGTACPCRACRSLLLRRANSFNGAPAAPAPAPARAGACPGLDLNATRAARAAGAGRRPHTTSGAAVQPQPPAVRRCHSYAAAEAPSSPPPPPPPPATRCTAASKEAVAKSPRRVASCAGPSTAPGATRPSPAPLRPSRSCFSCPVASAVGYDEQRQLLLGRKLLKAAYYGRYKAARKLLEGGANPNFCSSALWTPLHRAAAKAHANVVALLLRRGAAVDAKNCYGFTPLHIAAYDDYSGRCVSALVEAGADLGARNAFGRTPTHYAAEAGNMAALLELVAGGASPRARDDDGRTPFDVARSQGVRRLLRPERKGGEPSVVPFLRRMRGRRSSNRCARPVPGPVAVAAAAAAAAAAAPGQARGRVPAFLHVVKPTLGLPPSLRRRRHLPLLRPPRSPGYERVAVNPFIRHG